MMNKKVYKFPNLVKLVAGYQSSVILDLHRSEWYSIPNSMRSFVIQNEFENVKNTVANINDLEDREIVDEYFQFLLEKELIFELEPELQSLFPTTLPKYDEPELISNAVVYLTSEGFNNISEIFSRIERTGCKYFQLKLDLRVEQEHLAVIESIFRYSSVLSLDLIVKEVDSSLDEDDLLAFVNSIGRIKNLCIHKWHKNLIVRSDTNMDNIIFLESEVDFNLEYLGMENFVVNTFSFSESLEFNLYFNKKLFIDSNGDIKNSQNSEKIGNILKEDLNLIVKSKGFQKFWYVTKDEIDVCSDCEFQNICVDYRIPIKGEDGYYYEDMNACKYNPYIAKWSNEAGWISVTDWRREQLIPQNKIK